MLQRAFQDVFPGAALRIHQCALLPGAQWNPRHCWGHIGSLRTQSLHLASDYPWCSATREGLRSLCATVPKQPWRRHIHPEPGKVPVLHKRARRVQQRLSGSFAPERGWRGTQIITSSPVKTWTDVLALPRLHKASTRSSRGLTAYKASALAWNSPWQESKVWNRKYNYFTSPLCSCNSTAA